MSQTLAGHVGEPTVVHVGEPTVVHGHGPIVEHSRPLRDDGGLAIGSGFTTHGLPFLDDPSPDATLRGGRWSSTPVPQRGSRREISTASSTSGTRPPGCR